MKVYRIRYTHDNRIKSIHETDGESESNRAAWWVIVGGIVAALIWVIAW